MSFGASEIGHFTVECVPLPATGNEPGKDGEARHLCGSSMHADEPRRSPRMSGRRRRTQRDLTLPRRGLPCEIVIKKTGGGSKRNRDGPPGVDPGPGGPAYADAVADTDRQLFAGESCGIRSIPRSSARPGNSRKHPWPLGSIPNRAWVCAAGWRPPRVLVRTCSPSFHLCHRLDPAFGGLTRAPQARCGRPGRGGRRHAGRPGYRRSHWSTPPPLEPKTMEWSPPDEYPLHNRP